MDRRRVHPRRAGRPGAAWRIRLTSELRAKVTGQAPDGWLPLNQAAAALGVARQTVLHEVQRGELAAVHVRHGRRSRPASTLSFWRNYHLAISGRFGTGILGIGWSAPWQTSLSFESDGTVDLNTVGEPTDTFQPDTRGGYFTSDSEGTLAHNADGTYTMTSVTGESDTYSAAGNLAFHQDSNGNRLTFNYNGSGQLITVVASTGQSFHFVQRVRPAFHADRLRRPHHNVRI